MTNLFPREALDNTRAKYKDDEVAIKVLDNIEKAQQNYEIRDLLLSVWARINPEAIAYHKTGDVICAYSSETFPEFKRVIYYNDKPFPFKQSAPHKLVDLFMESDYFKSRMFKSYIIYGKNLQFSVDVLFGKILGFKNIPFFCSKEYTEETGIEPHICTYDECIELYEKYLEWKINQKKGEIE